MFDCIPLVYRKKSKYQITIWPNPLISLILDSRGGMSQCVEFFRLLDLTWHFLKPSLNQNTLMKNKKWVQWFLKRNFRWYCRIKHLYVMVKYAASLYVIIVNIIIRLMWSKVVNFPKTVCYYYSQPYQHVFVNVIKYIMAQSDHIKQHLFLFTFYGTWSSARIAIARKICSTRFYYCSTPFEQ